MSALDRLSITRKAPLLMSALLAVVVIVQVLVGYVGFRRVLITHEGDRLDGVAQLVAQLLTQSIGQRAASVERLAQEDAVRTILSGGVAGPTRAASLERLAEALGGEAQGVALTVRDLSGACVAAAWRPQATDPVRSVDGCPEWSPPPDDLPEPGAGPSRIVEWPAGQYSYALVSAVRNASGEDAGRLVLRVAISSAAGTQLLASLIAPDARLVFGNADGSAGTEGLDELPPAEISDLDRVHRFTFAGDDRIGVGAPITNTTWAIWVHRSEAPVLAPARQIVAWNLWSGLVLLILGSLVAWWASTRLTGPLLQVTEGAEAVSEGNLDRRVPADREDELGRLAHAFNVMADAVQKARDDLEARVALRTRELEQTVERLHDAQEELVRSEKLAMLGQLAGGVGHELRNPLSVMTNAVYFLKAILGDAPAKVHEYLGIVSAQIDRSQKIVGDLLDYARVKNPTRAALQASEVLERAVERAHPSSEIKVVRSVPDGLTPLWIDGEQVGQVLLNLVMNAVQAMEDTGGTLTVAAVPDGDGMVRLDVIDTGPGVPPNLREKIFQPLFTTKARGIGLGLAISRSLAEANGGRLELETPEGGGTRFSLVLPTVATNGKDGGGA